MHFLLLYPLLIHFVNAIIIRPDTYVWLEQNSYICDLELTNFRTAMKFLTTEEAVTMKCDCGDPLETESACAKKGTELPMCRKLPELCLREYMVLFTATENRLMQPLTTRDPNETTTPEPTAVATTSATTASTTGATTPPTTPPTLPPTLPPTQRRQPVTRPTIRPVNRSRPPFRPFPSRPGPPQRSRPSAQRGPQRVFTLENRFPTTPRPRTRNRRPFPTPGPIIGRPGFRRPPPNPRERSRERFNRLPPRSQPASKSRERSREVGRRPRPQQRTARPVPRPFQQRPSFTSREVFVPRSQPQFVAQPPPPQITKPRLPPTTPKPPTTTTKKPEKVFVPPPLPPQPETTTEKPTEAPITTIPPTTPAPTTTTEVPVTTTTPADTTTSVALFPKKKNEPTALASLDDLSNVKQLITKLIKEMSGDSDPLEGLEKLFEQRKKEREAKKSSKVSSSEQPSSAEVQQVQFRTVMDLKDEENSKKPPTTTVAPTTAPKPTTIESFTTADPMIVFLKQRIEQLESSLMQANKGKKIIKREKTSESSVNNGDETSTASDIKSFESSSEMLESLLNNAENDNKKIFVSEETKIKIEQPNEHLEKKIKNNEERDSRIAIPNSAKVLRRGSRSSEDSALPNEETGNKQEKESDASKSHSSEVSSRERLRQIHEVAAKRIRKPIHSQEKENSIENVEKKRLDSSESLTTQSPLNDVDVQQHHSNKKNLATKIISESRSDSRIQELRVTSDTLSEEKLSEEAMQREIDEVLQMESTTSLNGNNLRDSVLSEKSVIQSEAVTPQPERKIYFTTSKFNARICEDNHPLCEYWAFYKQCGKNAGYMYKYCRKACGICDYRFRL